MVILKRKSAYELWALATLMLFESVAGSITVLGALLPEGLVIEDIFKPGFGKPVGIIRGIGKDAIIIHAGILRGYRAKADLPLFKGDTLITQTDARIKFELNDGSIITMGQESKLTLSRSVFDPAKKARSSFILMDSGNARFEVTKPADFGLSEFSVKTQTALVSVKGSDFILKADEKITQVTALDDTLLEVVSLSAPDAEPLRVRASERTFVEHGKLPSPVEKISRDVIEKMKEELRISSSENGTEAGASPGQTKPEPEAYPLLTPTDELVPPQAAEHPNPTEEMMPDRTGSEAIFGETLRQQEAVSQERHEEAVRDAEMPALPNIPQ